MCRPGRTRRRRRCPRGRARRLDFDVVRLSAILLLACGLLVGATGCGSTTPRATPAAQSPAVQSPATPVVHLGPAKRRYLAHFKTDCRRVDSLSAASGDRLAQLIGQIRGGDPRAVRRLTVYLHALAGAFGQGLRATHRLGSPPNPDARYGQAYLASAGQIVTAIGRLGDAVAHLDARGVGSATRLLKSATTNAQTSAARYGIPTCGKGAAGSPPLTGPSV
jgi:hypothetical protein